ncbi:MAG: lamin tail domain-containing protein [Balneolaceae bacterium]
MLRELLSRVRTEFRLAAFFMLLFVFSGVTHGQSVLLPGDVAIVSVNSSNHSFDFVPLVDIEKGTSIWFTNGKWDSESSSLQGGVEVEVFFQNSVRAGTNVHINSVSDPRIELLGHFQFSENENRIFTYQKEEGIHRFIYGIGWGSADVWSSYLREGFDIPQSISLEDKTVLRLGSNDNYQYHLKNGASGTSRMLLSFISDPAKWVGRDKRAYSSFGTSFRLLTPPVVLFDESISTVQEGDVILLNVAVYEHDGSRLTVNVDFNEFNSTADSNDIDKFKTQSFNFTGLIGDAVYSQEIPITNDEHFETTETGFFELSGLSKGNLGDFITHVAFIQDNDIPAVRLTEVVNSGNSEYDFISIRNTERQAVDLSGWELTTRSLNYVFPENTEIQPLSELRISKNDINDSENSVINWIQRGDNELELRNQAGIKISDYLLTDEVESEIISMTDDSPNLTFEIGESNTTSGNTQIQRGKEVMPPKVKEAGWYVTSLDDIDIETTSNNPILFWSEPLSQFVSIDEYGPPNSKGTSVLAYFEEQVVPETIQDSLSTILMQETSDVIEFELSATDLDENGIINGIEGFNFVTNTSTNPVLVRDFMKLVEEQTKPGVIYPYVYLMDENLLDWNKAKVLGDNNVIPSKSSFWIKADSTIETILISFQTPQFYEPELEQEETEPVSTLKISLESDEFEKTVSINLVEEGQEFNRDLLAPELDLHILDKQLDYFFFGAKKGADWHRDISLDESIDQKIVIPLAFSVSFSGEFSLKSSGINEFSAGWNIQLKDMYTDKDYDLTKTGSITFDYTVDEDDTESDRIGTPLQIVSDRFQLVLYPPGVNEEEDVVTDELRLNQNYPNPFNPRTTISFYLPEALEVKLSIFNIVGQPILVLADGMHGSGDHEYEWDASGLPSGMYIYQLEVGNKITTQKMTLVK